jgi:hypothetical protein
VTLGVRQATPPGQDPAKNTSPVTTVGVIENDRRAYQARGGICDLSYAQLGRKQQTMLEDDNCELVLQTGLNGILLSETPYMVTSDSGCNYLDELEPGQTWEDPLVRQRLAEQQYAPLSGDIDVYVRHRGKVPAGRTALRVEQWRETPTGLINEYGVYRYPTLLQTDTITIKGGVGSYRLTPVQGPGLRLFRFVGPGNYPQDISPNTLAQLAFQEFFVELRVLPFDDYSQLRDEDITFDLIYDEIFRYYNLVLPAMTERLDLADAAIWQTPTAAHYVLRMIHEKLWGYYNYMPRTRDLSRYRRDLLRRFCAKVLAGNAGPGRTPGGPAQAGSA